MVADIISNVTTFLLAAEPPGGLPQPSLPWQHFGEATAERASDAVV